MRLEDEKTATNVTAEGSASAAAKNAEIASAGELAGGAPIARQASSSETLVSPELRAEIQTIVEAYLEARHVATLEEIGALITERIDNATADTLAHLTPMLTAVVEKSRTTPGAPAVTVHYGKPPADLTPVELEDPVKVWVDAEHKNFRVGTVVAVHEDGHAFDVELDDGSVTKVPADGLEYDDRS